MRSVRGSRPRRAPCGSRFVRPFVGASVSVGRRDRHRLGSSPSRRGIDALIRDQRLVGRQRLDRRRGRGARSGPRGRGPRDAASARPGTPAGSRSRARSWAGSRRLRSARASWASLRLRTIRARWTRLIWPFSSDTTTTIASVCSVVPERGAMAGAEPLGVDRRLAERQQRAGGEDPARRGRSTAPSWSGDFGEKIVRTRSAERSPWIITPVSAICSRPVSRSITMSAPWPSAERTAAARDDLGRDQLGDPRLGRHRASPASRRGRCGRARGGAPAGRRRRARTGRRRRPSRGSG